MSLATLGWGLWWIALGVRRWLPGFFPGLTWVWAITGVIALIGLVLAVFTIRARLIWVLLAGVPVFANGTLLLLPLVVDEEVVAALE